MEDNLKENLLNEKNESSAVNVEDDEMQATNTQNQLNKNWTTQMRLGFIRKVYGILLFQLSFTFLMCLISVLSPSFAKFQASNRILLYLSLAGNLVTAMIIICSRKLARQVPWNYVILGLFTFFEAYLVSTICGMTDPQIVLMAAIMTLTVTCALTLYACTTDRDFTVMGSMIFILLTILLLLGIFGLFTSNPFIHVVYCSLGVLVYSLYLVYDTQLIVGNHENKLEIDDYIVGALMLYIDIIQLFLYILELLSQKK